MIRRRTLATIVIVGFLAGAGLARAQGTSGWGRVNLWGMWSQTSLTGPGNIPSYNFSEVSASVALHSPSADAGGFEYGVDMRGAGFPSTEGRDNQYSIYDAWIGGRTRGGALGLRAGQMWLNELGSLGSFAGLFAEYRQPEPWTAGRFRAGIFGGLEPKILDPGYEKDIRKYGAFVALDGDNARSSVLGYARITDKGMTERSVLTMTNFIPAGRTFFLYQAAEFDLEKPGGLGKSGLNYLFANVRWVPVTRVELQALYHNGRSIDARTISQDVLAGRPVDARTIEGFLFESYGGRVTVEVIPTVRIYAGYSRERDNQQDSSYGRTTLGLFVPNLAHSGIDISISDNRSDRPSGAFDAWYVSLGRNFGAHFYFSADYSTSLSVLKLVNSGGITVTTEPRSKRYSLYGLWNMNRHLSLSLTGEHLTDDTSKSDRLLLGLMYRF